MVRQKLWGKWSEPPQVKGGQGESKNRNRVWLRWWMFAIAPTEDGQNPPKLRGWGGQKIVALTLMFALPYWLATPQTMAQEQRPPVRTQQANIREVWRVVYQRLPDFPLENNYVNKKTGEVDSDNTLASRLLAYHLQIKSRLPTYRLDWKLTLADYLGANEEIDPDRYPGWDVFRENPAAGDRVAISKLNRSQRDALILVLVTIFNPNYDKSSETSTPSSPEETSPSAPPPLPQSGDADLLK